MNSHSTYIIHAILQAELNPFYVPDMAIKSPTFLRRVTAVAKKHLL